jgi:hypothetical protein
MDSRNAILSVKTTLRDQLRILSGSTKERSKEEKEI